MLVDAIEDRGGGGVDDRERRLELVRRVLEETTTRRIRSLQRLGHAVEGASQVADLVAPLGHRSSDDRGCRQRHQPRRRAAVPRVAPVVPPPGSRAPRHRPQRSTATSTMAVVVSCWARPGPRPSRDPGPNPGPACPLPRAASTSACRKPWSTMAGVTKAMAVAVTIATRAKISAKPDAQAHRRAAR